MVGLSLAWQLLENNPTLSICILEKEAMVGKHGSGRNSGVLHAGIYYQPDTVKARVCVRGAKRLRAWCKDEGIPVLDCGKVITPQKPELDSQLDVLIERGRANGAKVELIDQAQFNELVPDGLTTTGRAIWSPNTCVVSPKQVINHLSNQLAKRGVNFLMARGDWTVSKGETSINLNGQTVSFSHLYNCAGLQSDRVAHRFGIGHRYTILPFKGSYYQLKKSAPFNFTTNLYPVPDLEVPFLGVHVTPSTTGDVFLGPTATPSLGRENYSGLMGVNPLGSVNFARHMTSLALKDKKMKRYIFGQSLEWMPHRFLRAANLIVPALEMGHMEKSSKVGIRPQLYDKKAQRLIQDFLMLEGSRSTHIINAISPAFTASFELADHIINRDSLN